jgi:hypothetical protein
MPAANFIGQAMAKALRSTFPVASIPRMGLCPCPSWRFAADEHFIDNIVEAYAKAYPNLKYTIRITQVRRN